MNDEAIHPIRQFCCRKYIQVFNILVVTTIFLFISWNIIILYSVSDARFLKENSNSFYCNTIDTSEKYVVTPPPVISCIIPHNSKYLIREDNICNFTNSSVYLIVIVCVAPANLKGRVTIRETWGSVVKTNKEVKLIFMLGQTLNAQVQNRINNESSHFHDIVQEDFLDSYRNLSLKSAAMLKWSYKYCPSAKYTLKADDDMFVNIEYLLKVLKLRNLTNTVIGMQITGARPIRNKNSKWYTPSGLFNETVYPSYCSGTSYVISGDAVERLYNTTLVTPSFWLEDIYITGICRTKANVKIFYDYGFTYEKPNAAGCVFRKRITGHRYDEREIRNIWKELTNSSLKCDD